MLRSLVNMTTNCLFRRISLPIVLASIALTIAACGDSEKFPPVVEVQGGNPSAQVVLANSEILLGSNRFVVGILGSNGLPIVDADVHFRFYDLTGESEEFAFEMPGVSRVPSRDVDLPMQVEHIHSDGSVHIHYNVGEEVGVYTANVEFPHTGWWGVEVTARKDGETHVLRPRFTVVDRSSTPPIGTDAPRSRNLTVADVDDIRQIDTSHEPSEEMHTTTIADAIEAGRPTLVLFAVPGFCTSRICGPVLEIMRDMYPEWRDDVEFIHVEFFEDPGPNTTPVEAAIEWGLRTEPWFFVIDKDGKVSAKFEGPTTRIELEEALEAVTQ